MTAPFSIQSPAAYMGCQKSTGHTRLLARYEFESEDDETGATDAVTAGHYAALATFETDFHYGGSTSALVVYDLRTGAPVRWLGGESVSCEGYSCETTLNDLVINDRGFTAVHAVASIPCPGPPSGNRCEQIEVSDDGGPRTVDTATSSAATPFSVAAPVLTDLTLMGDTLTWQHSGSNETAQLH
jgi:hypothetical protein